MSIENANTTDIAKIFAIAASLTEGLEKSGLTKKQQKEAIALLASRYGLKLSSVNVVITTPQAPIGAKEETKGTKVPQKTPPASYKSMTQWVQMEKSRTEAVEALKSGKGDISSLQLSLRNIEGSMKAFKKAHSGVTTTISSLSSTSSKDAVDDKSSKGKNNNSSQGGKVTGT